MEKKGQVVLDLRPGEGNPRNSEGAFLPLKDGTLMFAYSRFIGDSQSDTAKACIAVRISEDEGDTWSGDRIIATPDQYDALNIMSVSLMRMQNGDIGMFYVLRYGWHDTRLRLFRSSDEGMTWGEPVLCAPGKGYYVTNNDRVIRLKSGRLVIPMALHKMKTSDHIDWSSFDSRGVAYFYLSDDDGYTWREAKNGCSLMAPSSKSGLQEPGVVQLNNGALWAYFRTDTGVQYEAYSVDEGETWGQATPSIFTSPTSPLSVKRNPNTGDLLAVWNPIPNYQTRVIGKHDWGRTPLVAAVSKDDGKTWGDPIAVQLEQDGGGYCYTAIHFTKDAVLLAYCAGEEEDGICLARLKMTKIMLSELE